MHVIAAAREREAGMERKLAHGEAPFARNSRDLAADKQTTSEAAQSSQSKGGRCNNGPRSSCVVPTPPSVSWIREHILKAREQLALLSMSFTRIRISSKRTAGLLYSDDTRHAPRLFAVCAACLLPT